MGNVNVRPDESYVEPHAEPQLQQQHDSSYFTDDFDSLDSSFDYSQRGSNDGSLIGQISTTGSFAPEPQLDFQRRTRMFLSFRNPPSAKHVRRNSWDFSIIHKSGSSLSLVQTNLKRITSKISVGLGIFDDNVEDETEKRDDDEVFHPISNLRRAKSMRYPSESNSRVRFASDVSRAEPVFNRKRGGSLQRHQGWKQGHRRQPSISIPRGSDFGSSSESLLTKQKPLSPRVSQLKREERMERIKVETTDLPQQIEEIIRFENAKPKSVVALSPLEAYKDFHRMPSYVEADQYGRWKLRLRQDEAMDDLGCSVSIREVGSLLKSQYAYISGGRSRDHCALITFPDRSHATSSISDEDYRKLVIYLTSVAPLQDADLGFVLIIDRRNDKWNAVKSSLIRISNFFPGLISAAYVLRPSGLLQKAISEVSNKLFREDFKFKVVVCSCLEDLYNYVDTDQLTPDFGGSLRYNHDDWIDARMSIEKFSDNVSEMSTSLKKFSRRLNESEVPNEVTAIETLLSNQSGDYLQLKEEIGKIIRQGKSLQDQIKDTGNELSRNVELSPSQIINLSTVQRYLKEAEELDFSLDAIWRIHEGQLNQVLLLRRFEMDFKELQPVFSEILQNLSAMKESGDCLSDILNLIEETELDKSKCQECLNRSDELWSEGQRLLNEYCKVDSVQASVKPKTVELESMKVQCLLTFEKRLETLEKSRTLYEKIEKVNRWCATGIELLASQPLEKYGTVEHAEVGVNDIDAFLKSSRDSEELEAYLQELTVPESRALVLQVLKRVEDVHVMCNRRRVSLKKIITRPPKPVQPVTPEPAVPVQLVKPREVRPRLRSTSRQETSPATETNPDLEAMKVKRGHILTELLETEKTYVSEIGIVLKGYRDEMINPDNQIKIPPTLLGKEEVLFGNLEQIHDFHSHIFLPDLEHFIHSPQMISQCFLRRKNELHELYSYYCQNIPQSEELRKTAGEQNSFLRECQLKLGHKLPLGAYLLKPVQRITKYQLLLKDLLKCEAEPNSSGDLQTALDSMLAVLRTVNDSMHQVAITGYQGSLADLGRLLLQGSFNVWTEGKRDRLRDLRLKPMQRHIFLYEKAVVMCKRVGKDPDKATYQYKHSLNMSEVGLTEKVHSGRGSDGRRFELWLQGRQEVWLLQAPAVDVKETWVCEVKRVLLSQFQRLKCQTGRNPTGRYVMSTSRHSTPLMSPSAISPTANHRTVRSTASWDYYPSSSSSGIGSDRGSVNESIQSGDRTSRDTPSMHNYSNEEEDGWSTDFSLSDDDDGDHVPKPKDSICARRYLALADYAPLGPAEVRMHEGDLVELIRIGSAGWWYVRVPGPNNTTNEGWAPSAYLEVQSVTKRSPGGSTGTPSLGSQDSGMEKETKDLQVFSETSRV